ncbi:MAG: ATP-binding protein [Oscillospiraceae bacterium]
MNLKEELVLDVCRQAAGENFGTKAKRVNKIFSWNDLIINKECEDLLYWICDLVKSSSVIYDDLGFAKKTAYGRSVSALFYGPPGTGRTMAAQVVANELGQDLYKVDLSQMISKYIGETEKNLNAIFDVAGKANVVLFFDEADALFGKQTQITNSNDKFANNETSFLLQKIEKYSGVAILATNLAVSFDSAFKRRIKVMVNFALPDAKLRLKLWHSVFPKEVDAGEIDFEYLAEKLKFRGV